MYDFRNRFRNNLLKFSIEYQVARKKKITKNNENDDWTKKRKKKHEIHTNGRPSIWAVFFLLRETPHNAGISLTKGSEWICRTLHTLSESECVSSLQINLQHLKWESSVRSKTKIIPKKVCISMEHYYSKCSSLFFSLNSSLIILRADNNSIQIFQTTTIERKATK